MKTNRLTIIATATLGLATLPTAGCADKTTPADAATPAANAMPTAATASTGTATSIHVAKAVSSDVASAQWVDIKDCTYDMRAQFFAGLKLLEAKVDRQIGELTAKRAAMNGTVETKNWDFAMEAMHSARSYLKSMREELSSATAATWTQKKDKVGLAWARTQDAYSKVVSSTTS